MIVHRTFHTGLKTDQLTFPLFKYVLKLKNFWPVLSQKSTQLFFSHTSPTKKKKKSLKYLGQSVHLKQEQIGRTSLGRYWVERRDHIWLWRSLNVKPQSSNRRGGKNVCKPCELTAGFAGLRKIKHTNFKDILRPQRARVSHYPGISPFKAR